MSNLGQKMYTTPSTHLLYFLDHTSDFDNDH